jgi:hypothetical protein
VSTTEELTKHARFLRNASPSAFQGFYAAFVDYTDRQYEILVDAGENLQVLQGQAKQCKKILEALERAKDG